MHDLNTKNGWAMTHSRNYSELCAKYFVVAKPKRKRSRCLATTAEIIPWADNQRHVIAQTRPFELAWKWFFVMKREFSDHRGYVTSLPREQENYWRSLRMVYRLPVNVLHEIVPTTTSVVLRSLMPNPCGLEWVTINRQQSLHSFKTMYPYSASTRSNSTGFQIVLTRKLLLKKKLKKREW